MNDLKISIRFEGGLGDVLAANRFIPAIKEKWGQDCLIDTFLDNENNSLQESALRLFYPSFYNNIETIKTKKYSKFVIDTQFGEDIGFGGLENVPDDIVKRMTEDYNVFYDLHIDGMKWINYDFDWLRYFKFFPKPKIKFCDKFSFLPEKFAVLHLASNNLRSNHTNEVWYNKKLIKKISSEIPCVILCTPLTESYLRECLEGVPEDHYFLISPPLDQVGYLISQAEVFLGMDSGLVYLAYGLGIPTYVFSAHCINPGEVLPSHLLRWLPFPEKALPKNYDINYVSALVLRTAKCAAYNLVPQLTDFENQAIVRNYKVNLEKSIIQ